jgi:molecular chaperone DnaK
MALSATDRERVIGIDLGTTNACVAIVESGVPMVIPNSQGQTLLPAVVAVGDNGKRIIGHMARRQSVVLADHTATALKRLIGRKFGSQVVRQMLDTVGYRITSGPSDEVYLSLRGESGAVIDFYATLIAELKRTAEQYLHEPVHKAVFTVPVHFTDAQRHAVKEAGQRAGLEVLRIVQEATAAGIAYGIGQGEAKAQRVATYSLGGGAFDFTVLGLRSGVYETQANASDIFLGGDDFDRRILDWLIFNFAKDHKIDLRQDRTALQRLRDAVEKAKCELSSLDEVSIDVPFIISTGTSEPLHLVRILSRSKLEELTEDLIERTLQICRSALAEAGIDPHEIDTVILVGGMTRMPRVQAAVQEFFGRTPSFGLPPEEVIAIGAALQAAALVPVSTPPPIEVPVERVVVTHPLGLLCSGGQCFRLVEAGAMLPCERRYVFTTTRDQQTAMTFLVFEGSAERADENKLLGELLFDNLAPAARGEAEVEVRFQLEASGALTVTASDLGTQQQRTLQVATSLVRAAEALDAGSAGYALELRHDEVLVRTQQNIERLVTQIQGLLPRAEIAVGASDMGLDAVRRARAAIERAKIAIIRGEPVALLDAQSLLQRTATMLRGVTGSPKG